MKRIFFVLLTGALATLLPKNAEAQKAKAEETRAKCSTPFAERPVVAVANFYNEAPNGGGNLGGGLAEMLSNALGETECFQVVERKRLQDLMNEQGLGQSGAITPASAASVGQLLGARVSVIGVITEFTERESGGIGGIALGGAVVGVGSMKAHLGMIIKLVDNNNGVIIATKSVERKVTKVGLAGANWKGVGMAGMGFKSKAMADAAEECIIDAVELICAKKDIIKSLAAAAAPKKAELPPRGSCALLNGAKKPRIMVIIPEVHIARKVPDPAGETEIIKRLIEFGYEVVDPGIVAAIRDQERVNMARTDVGRAAQLGVEFGADIVVIGEAFSEGLGARNGMQSCRARLEARAVSTANGRILATNGIHAAGLDNSELLAGKKALATAGGEFADYLLIELCKVSELGGGGGDMVSSSEVLLANVSFGQLNTVYNYLKKKPQVKSITKSLNGPSGRLQVVHTGPLDDIAGLLDGGQSGVNVAITGLGGSKIDGVVK